MKKLYTVALCAFVFWSSVAWLDVSGTGGASSPVSGLWDGASPMADSHCVGAWYMNGTGTETDRSGSSEDLTEYSDINQSETIPTGYHADGYSRYSPDAANALYHTDGGSSDLSGAGSWTFGTWVKFNSDNSADNMIFHNWTTTDDNRQIRIKFDDSDDNFVAEVSELGTLASVVACNGATNRATLGTESFFHLFVVYNGSTIKIYINNVEDGTVNYSSGVANKTGQYGLFSEASIAYGNTFDGHLDEAIWFNIALSSDQRADIITNGISGDKGASDS